MRAAHLAGWLGAAILAAPFAASGQSAVETRFFDDEGRARYAHRDYKGALREFLQADAVTPSARSLYNIAVTAELAGERGLAFVYLEEYLAGTDADAERRRDAEDRRAKLEKKLALVLVTSEPAGASIFVDGTEYGEYGKTPRRIALEPGKHRIELLLADHQPRTVEVAAEVGKTASAQAALDRRTGTLIATSDPPGATFEVSRAGRPVAAKFDDGRAALPVGELHVRAVAPGRVPAEMDVVVREGETSRATFVTAAVPVPVGRLLVGATGVAARVLVDGRAKAVAPATLDGLPIGRHDVELQADGYEPWRGPVVVKEGKPTYLDVSLRRTGR